jgi:hypothetical protein
VGGGIEFSFPGEVVWNPLPYALSGVVGFEGGVASSIPFHESPLDLAGSGASSQGALGFEGGVPSSRPRQSILPPLAMGVVSFLLLPAL